MLQFCGKSRREFVGLVSFFLYRVRTQVWCKIIEDLEKGAERGDLNVLRIGRIDLGTRRVAGVPQTPVVASKSTSIDL